MPPTNDDITHQQKLLDTHRQNLALYLKQQALQGGEAYVQPAVRNGIAEARKDIARIKQILRSWNVAVDNHPDDGDAVIEPAKQQTPGQQGGQLVERGTLRKVLNDSFNEDELRDLCFDLQIDYDSLPGSGKAAKARELVTYSERHGRYADLVRRVKELRQNVSWI